jgi:hypothetical protein
VFAVVPPSSDRRVAGCPGVAEVPAGRSDPAGSRPPGERTPGSPSGREHGSHRLRGWACPA